MARRRCKSPTSPDARKVRNEAGFTLAEVLVVALIIGILAGVTVPSFFNQRSKADDTSGKATARAAASAIEAYASDNLGSYEGASGTILNAIDSAVPANTDVIGVANCAGYNLCYQVKPPANPSTGNVFWLNKWKDGSVTSDCSTHGTGGCPSDGHWGTD